MKETSKAHQRRRGQWAFVHRYFVGCGLEIGGSDDPLNPADWPMMKGICDYTQPDGSPAALPFADEQFDFVYASNVLEHMLDVDNAIAEWLRVLRPGGHLIFTVPDFELYEQGIWPSRWNAGHRQRFDVISVWNLLMQFNVRIKKIELVDTRYEYGLRGIDQTLDEHGAEAFIEAVAQKM